MPGIVGLVTKSAPESAKQQLHRMLQSMRHEPFYTSGTWSDENIGVYVGWVAHKGAFSEAMPLYNERRNAVLVFSGEDFADPDVIAAMKRRGHNVDPNNASYLVHAYEEDPDFISNLNGRFQGLLADLSTGSTTLFNDRYGMYRLYYHEAKDALYFAAEAKAILAVRPELRRFDNRSFGELVTCGCVLDDRTIFEGIHAVPGGSAWIIRNGSLKKGRYFEPKEWELQAPLHEERYYEDLRNAFVQHLPRYFRSRQQVGVALTGGMDTRVIMAWRNPAPKTLPCYTFGSMFRNSHDVTIAKEVADVCHQSHQVITVGQEFLSRFQHYLEKTVYLTEGGVDASRSPDLYVSEKAREISPVKVVGTYGSEILRQAVMFKPVMPTPGLLSGDVMPTIHQAANTYEQFRGENPVTFAAFRQSPWAHFGILALEQSQLTVRSPYLDNAFVQTVYRAPTSAMERDVRLRLLREGNPALARIRTDFGFAGRGGWLVGGLSHQMRMFSHRAEYAYDYGMPHWLARMDGAMAPLHLERLFLGRHKMYHFRVWYRDHLSQYLQDIMLDSRSLSRSYLDRKGVEVMLRSHLKGDRNYTSEIHKILTLELLHRLFIEAEVSSKSPISIVRAH
jgi:asparagine synthase (glutamine-hydrolysing)